jgi:hypothetical protein
LEIVPENDSVTLSNSDIAYYLLKCDRFKINLTDGLIVSTTKEVINERLTYPNLRRTFDVEFPGADARYDYTCWSVTVKKNGVETPSVKKILKVGEPPSEASGITLAYTLDKDASYSNKFEVSYNLPARNGSALSYISVFLRTRDGAYKRICHKLNPKDSVEGDKKCSVNANLLLDNPFSLIQGDPISVYIISENAFGKSKITYSTTNFFAKTPPKVPLIAPAELIYETPENQIVINITPVEGAAEYELWYKKITTEAEMYNTTGYVLFGSKQSSTTFIFNTFDLALGDIYAFKFLPFSDFGPSKYSPPRSITLASVPDRMLPPILTYSVENSGSVKVRMLSSQPNGAPITKYLLKIKSVQGDLVELPWCNATEEECHYPSYVLKDSPFYLEEGHIIYASSANSNIKGDSEFSSLSEGLELKGAPKSPPNPPYSGSSTNKYQISIKVDELSEEYAGKERIISYNVVVQFGDNNFISLAGDDNQTPFTDTEREILFYDVEIGKTYRFLYRVKNAFGWSGFSEIGYITVPNA